MAPLCESLQLWGATVVVGRRALHESRDVECGVTLDFMNVIIDRRDSEVGNPFVKARRLKLCMA